MIVARNRLRVLQFAYNLSIRLGGITKTKKAKIHIVHIATEKQFARKEQMKWFREMREQQVDYDNLEFKVISFDHIVKDTSRSCGAIAPRGKGLLSKPVQKKSG